ncbi:hypothetical protein J23TS9_21430 [Paenibacillus sp. J23TS9]|uniref:hypothetical protein n=1 Tax=Paenibacillus sp. J23TS9 TaxID=2807193 RepID=UPI001B13DD4F|nr:hypothetical protein [Paenibacillus sp. J23TS9]GIP27013.1 hypothetical protein J23TS9_21430 [Paenibacillus sp. J23TS9]
MIKRRSKYSKFGITASIFILCMTLFMARPIGANASDTGWDNALTSIEKLHDTYTSVDASNKVEKQQLQALRKQNNNKLKDINTKVQSIDKAKIDKLKVDADQTEKKFAPLLKEYTELGKKASEARKRKDQKSALLYDLKRNRIKSAAIAARQEVKIKKDALASARKQASAKAKVVKDALAQAQTLKKHITSENLKITDVNKTRAAADKRYKAAVKQGDAIAAAGEMRQMVGVLTQVHASQLKMFEWERQITQTLRAAEEKLPS